MFHRRRKAKWLLARHHHILEAALLRVYAGDCKRLIINMPPRYSKSEFATQFMAWCIGQHPDSEWIYVSYSSKLATKASYECRSIVTDPEYQELFPHVKLRDDSSAKDEWRTTAGGCVYAVGTGGTVTGYGAGKMRPGFGGAIIADDLHKADEADSDTIREGVVDWFAGTLESRTNSPDTPIIVIMQRLHERDVAGWLKAGGNGEEWEVLEIPAINPDGTALWPEKHSIERLHQMRDANPYHFSGQYMQRPTPGDGGTIKPDKIAIVDAVPDGTVFCRAWDFAATAPKRGNTDPDWTAGGKLGRMPDGRWIIADMVRMRGGPEDVEAALLNTAHRDGGEVSISLPQDPGAAGVTVKAGYSKLLAGFSFEFSPETGSKVDRARPFAAQVNVGNVIMLRAPWNDALIAEMRTFPLGAHDDQIDTMARAFAKVGISPSAQFDFL